MNLEKSVDNLAKRLDRLDPELHYSNKTDLSRWKGKSIIPIYEWIKIRNTPYALNYYPDDFNRDVTYISKGDLQKQENVKKWNSDFLELMEFTKNPNYGRLNCFHCLMSPDGDDPIFIGINRLVAKGLNNGEQQRNGIQYPCQIVNRFECPYERTDINDDSVEHKKPHFVEDLFRLQRMAFIVEIALAKARKNDSDSDKR